MKMDSKMISHGSSFCKVNKVFDIMFITHGNHTICGSYMFFSTNHYLKNMTIFNESEAQYRARIAKERMQRDISMADASTSPLTADQLSRFNGLNYFPVDMIFKISAEITRTPNQKVTVSLTNGKQQVFEKYGEVSFSVRNVVYRFEVLKNQNLPELTNHPDQLFIPFTDGTSGKESCENGRFISFDEPSTDGLVELDFNSAFCTYNAYNQKYVSVTATRANSTMNNFAVGQRRFEDRL